MLLGSIGSNNELAIGLRIYLKDEFTKQITSVKNTFGNFRQELEAYRSNLTSARNMYTGLAIGGALITSQLAEWVQYGAKFDFAMRGIKVVSGDTAEQITKIGEEAKSLAKSSIFAPEQISNMVEELAKRGYSGTDLSEFTKKSIALAGATVNDLIPTSEMLSNTMSGFRINTEDIGKTTDILTVALNKSFLGLQDFGDALHYAQFTAVNLKQQLPDVSAALMVLSNAGLRGSMAGTSLENMYRYLAKSLGLWKTKHEATSWQMLGFNPNDFVTLAGDLKPMPEILGAIGKALEKTGAGSIRSQTILNAIFGVRGTRTASGLIHAKEQYQEFLKILNNTPAGSTDKMFKERMDTLWGDMKTITNALNVLKINFSAALGPILRPLLHGIRSVINGLGWFLKTPFGSMSAVIVGGLIAVRTVIWTVKAALGAVYLAQSQLTVGFGSMMGSMKTGWSILTASVLGYSSALKGVIMGSTQMGLSNVTGSMMRAEMLIAQSQSFQAGSPGYYWKMGPGGRKRVSAETYERWQRIRGSAKERLAWGQNQRGALEGNVGALNNGKGMGMGGILLGLGGGLLSLIGGWPGVIIAGLSVIPSLIDVFSDHKDATQENTEALNKNTQNNEEIQRRIKVVQDTHGDRRYQISGLQFPQEVVDKMMNQALVSVFAQKAGVSNMKNATIQFVMDGKKIWEKDLDEVNDRTVVSLLR